MVLVIGGRSKIGSALIGILSREGQRVRALVRSGEGVDAFPAGIETVSGDLADLDSLVAAMSGVNKVFLLCGPTQDEVELNQNAIKAACAAEVELLVRSSILGSDPRSHATFMTDHGMCDEYLRDSVVPHVILRPNLFLQNIPESTIPSIDADGNFYANAGEARISMVDTHDVAAVAAAVLTEPGHEGNAYDVTGPEALSYHDVAAKLSDVLGRTITYVDAPDTNVREALLGFGIPPWMVGALVDLYQEYRRSGADGYAAQVTDAVQRLAGRPPRSLDELLAGSAATTAG